METHLTHGYMQHFRHFPRVLLASHLAGSFEISGFQPFFESAISILASIPRHHHSEAAWRPQTSYWGSIGEIPNLYHLNH